IEKLFLQELAIKRSDDHGRTIPEFKPGDHPVYDFKQPARVWGQQESNRLPTNHGLQKDWALVHLFQRQTLRNLSTSTARAWSKTVENFRFTNEIATSFRC